MFEKCLSPKVVAVFMEMGRWLSAGTIILSGEANLTLPKSFCGGGELDIELRKSVVAFRRELFPLRERSEQRAVTCKEEVRMNFMESRATPYEGGVKPAAARVAI